MLLLDFMHRELAKTPTGRVRGSGVPDFFNTAPFRDIDGQDTLFMQYLCTLIPLLKVCIKSKRHGKTECNSSEGDSERDESTEEQLQCKWECPCTPHGTLSHASLHLAIAMAMPEHQIHAPNPCYS